jgi:hypothetical protein
MNEKIVVLTRSPTHGKRYILAQKSPDRNIKIGVLM